MMEGKLNSRVIRGKLISVPRIDPTLCKAGQAADAKATGDYLRLLSAGGGISREIAAHMESRDNPHLVTAAQLGLGQVSNTADADKPVSLPQQRAIADACDQVKTAALLKSGGTMAGQLSMGGHRLTGLAAPEGAGDGVNKGYVEDYVNDKRKTFQAVILASGWSATPPYTNTVSIIGVQEADMPHIAAVITTAQIREAWCFVTGGTAKKDAIEFTALEDKPTVDIPIQVEVLR